MPGSPLGAFVSHLWLKDEIARELLEEELEDDADAPDDPDADRAAGGPPAGTHEPSFLTDRETDVDIVTGGADEGR